MTLPRAQIAIIGGGLTGSLLAILLARRGFSPVVYERSPHLNDHGVRENRSINLALAARGIKALKLADAYTTIEPILLPMKGRMIHQPGTGPNLQPYGQWPEEQTYSVSRTELNSRLYTLASNRHGVEYHFGHTCIAVNTDQAELIVESGQDRHVVNAEIILAADGAGSVVRQELHKAGLVKVQEKLLDHGYKELSVATTPEDDFAMAPDALHLWPRRGFMLIALPNLDRSFTATLFLPNKGVRASFAELSVETISEFFLQEFPDVTPLIPELDREFGEHPTGSLGTIHCKPWSWGHRIVLIGDAAHAIVPFHGQGMNAAFEDCTELDQLVGRFGNDWPSIVERFEIARIVNTNAIAQMALENYREMRDSVLEEKFRIQKKLAFKLEKIYPERFIPRYSMVMFHPEISYAEALRRGQIQTDIICKLTRNLSSVDEIDAELAAKLVEEHL